MVDGLAYQDLTCRPFTAQGSSCAQIDKSEIEPRVRMDSPISWIQLPRRRHSPRLFEIGHLDGVGI